MDGTGEHYAKWNKPGSERQKPYDLTYKWNLINKICEQNRTRDIEIKNKLTVTRGEGKRVNGERRGRVINETWTKTSGGRGLNVGGVRG